jgi:hypothetical protein
LSARGDFEADRPGLVQSINGGDAREARLARQAYSIILPNVVLSRSPLTGELITPRFDPVDLDGPWWDAHSPIRGTVDLPADVASFAGAVALGDQVASAPFLASPGPGLPFVYPDLLFNMDVVAVVSSVRIGPHTGYPILYFADPLPPGGPFLDWWGARGYRYGPHGAEVEGSSPGYEGDWDYDLTSWIRNERLLWIAPGDDEWALRRGLDGCPFVGLEGEKGIARVQNGEVWRTPDDAF